MYLVSRTETFAKLFFIVSFTGLFMYVALAFYSFHTAYTTVSQIGKYQERFNKFRNLDLSADRFENDLKYILLWTLNNEVVLENEGQGAFIENNCPEINCYLTTNKTILNEDYRNFDAIVFNTSLFWQWKESALPQRRNKRQKYVFYGMKASDDHPICNVRVDNFFNWTWTYKFYSDIFSPFIEVKDLSGTVLAPRRNVQWAIDVKSPKKSVVEEVSLSNRKTKAIAWIIDECNIKMNRMLSITKLKKALKEFNLTFDVYGCGQMQCPKEGCLRALQKDYYFYLAYEGSVSEDYVTTEVLKGYHHDAVPIVVGGADYSKFLPDNSYVNFQFYTEEKLAALIDYTIKNPSVYREYFNWKNSYTIQKADTFNGYCQLCMMLNDRKKYLSFSSYETFRTWWYFGSLKEICLPRGAENFNEIISYLNESVRF